MGQEEKKGSNYKIKIKSMPRLLIWALSNKFNYAATQLNRESCIIIIVLFY
jgi:hypothetical protein